MRKKILFIAGMMACCTWAGAQEISQTWVADKGNGTYQNPVLYADYSDPDVCAAGDDFYMTASSFNCIPGLPILHSRDLVNWSLVNYALPVRVQCAFIDTPEVEEITKFIARQQSYPTPFFLPEYVSEDSGSEVGDIDMGRLDPLFEDAARLVVIHQQGSTSLIQRKFAIGYNRAGRIMDQLEKAGIVGPTQGSKARDVLCIDDNDLEMRLNNLQ